MRLKFAAFFAGAFMFLTVPAFASPAGGVFCAGQVDGSTFSSLTAGGLTATAWSTGGSQETLVCKDGGVGEMGLGISGDENNEIDSDDFVQLDFNFVPFHAMGTFTIESVQTGESFDVWNSANNGSLAGAILLDSSSGGSNDVVTVTLDTGTLRYIDITAPTGNVLVDSVTLPTPEPSTYLLLGTGLLMLGISMRRKFASVSC